MLYLIQGISAKTTFAILVGLLTIVMLLAISITAECNAATAMPCAAGSIQKTAPQAQPPINDGPKGSR
ncbi:hypothetical protein BST81_11600 [Leptolyngbya sp. 'hensonii']|uniref:hypothetical protein n=1 Tax=Leptolyngbya sp. 'hensonii' TaxID=1922337 RepID=UPI00094FE2DC|nr:hypothetical protein [Leptolyngbya sp. 'hensonii']OLP18252.1 hypothetical protein BST81_11600 [Leptolyngbya sp. 'hensonii']